MTSSPARRHSARAGEHCLFPKNDPHSLLRNGSIRVIPVSPLRVLHHEKNRPKRTVFFVVEMIRLELTTCTLRTYRSTG